MKKTQADKKMALLDNQIGVLMQSFDTVQIFASKYDPTTKDTATFACGEGPWPSRMGQINDFMISATAEIIAKKLKDRQGEHE